VFVLCLVAVIDAEVPNGVFRWGTNDDSSILATWHFHGFYFENH
jgi:hypothetical protein